MAKIKTTELTGAALDWAAAKVEGFIATIKPGEVVYVHPDTGDWHHNGNWTPSTSWSQGGPIIEREGIETLCNRPAMPEHKDPAWCFGDWFACHWTRRAAHYHGPTPMIAAMRCYVARKLGEEVDVPDELLKAA